MEKPSFLKKKEQGSSLDAKVSYLKEKGLNSFEDWQKKTPEEKISILLDLNAVPYNFDFFHKKPNELKDKIISGFDNSETEKELDRNFDFFMRTIAYPGYQDKEQFLYPEETKNLAETTEDPKLKGYYQYSDHKYPEELLNLNPKVIECVKKQNPLEEREDIFSPINALKTSGIKNLSEWYGKSIDEKRKILMSSDHFFGVDAEVRKGKIPLILQYGKGKYDKYLDQCFYSTMYRTSEFLRWQNKWVNPTLNKEELLKNARQNLEKRMEDKFLQKQTEMEKILRENRQQIISDMHNSVDDKLSNLTPEERKEIKDFLELTIDDKEEV